MGLVHALPMTALLVADGGRIERARDLDATVAQLLVELVHEALIQRWGRLRGWMEADRAFRTWQERLRAALRGWETSERDEGALLRGAPLVEAEGWLTERGAELNPAEGGFIRTSVALREQRRAERERRRHAILALADGLVVALVLALLAGGQWQRAEVEVDARATAQAEAETAEGDALRQASIGLATQALKELQGKFPERAGPLALEALEAYPYTWQAERAPLGSSLRPFHSPLPLTVIPQNTPQGYNRPRRQGNESGICKIMYCPL